jgi:RNA polymerase sigma-70 factor (ECF subfamily)
MSDEKPLAPGPDETQLADEQDVLRASAGDRQAFERLVLRHQDAVVSAATYHTGNREDGIDVAQDTFLRAYRGIAGFRGGCPFRTWLLTIAANASRSCRSRRRALKRGGAARTMSTAATRDPDDPAMEIPDPDTSSRPATLAERKELKEALERAIGELDEDARTMVILRDLSGETYEAIAAALELPLGTVKSRLHRARLELREKIARFL